MNKKSLSIFFILALFAGAMYYSQGVRSSFIQSLNTLKATYFTFLTNIEQGIYQYFFQAQHINTLTQELQECKKNRLLMLGLSKELQTLYQQSHSSLKNNPQVELIRALSYEKFGNFNRLWMEIQDYNESKIYGLVSQDFVAGIVINKEHQPLALLNADIKSTYSVFIGSEHAPGIAHGNNEQNIIIQYIPAWYKIHKGDEVFTSGLDNIFFRGIKVGRVLRVSSAQGYQNAVVQPYFQTYAPNYFYLIRKTK